MNKTEIIKDAVRRFPQLGDRTVARYVYHNYGPIFDGSLEKIRALVRYRRGHIGQRCRDEVNEIIPRDVPALPQTWREKKQPYILSPGYWVVLFDLHVPFHEPIPVESVIKYTQTEKPDGVLYGGDFQDCASVGFWVTGRKRDFDKEIEETIDTLCFLENEIPVKHKVYKMGNHENRLPRYYQSRATELIGLPLALAVEAGLGLENRGFDVVEENQIIMAGKLPLFHGHEFKALHTTVNPARGLFNKTKSWAICGHCHRTSEHTSKNIQGDYLTTWSVGCLCDLNPDYNPFGNDWNWGFATINIEKDGNFEVVNKRILPNGKVV